MIIGIDGNEANVKQRVGVNTYAWEVLKNLRKLQDIKSGEHSLIVYLRDKPLRDMPKETQNFKYKIIPGGNFWIITKLMPYLWKNPDGIEILFTPSHYTVPFLPFPRICSIMDLGYLKFSGQFTKKVFWQLKWWSAISIFVSKYIISISESTKKDIVRHYPFSKRKVYVTYPGYDSRKFNTKISPENVRRVKERYHIVDDYIVSIGTLKPSKNIEGLLEAFSILVSKYPSIQLVIAGKKGWMFDTIFKKAEELGLSKNIIFTGFVPDKDKPVLIAGAKVFVIPSFWEGFGLDVLSAMAVGTPVVAANVASLPEVVGNAGILVDPGDPKSIAQGIGEVLSANGKKYNRIVAAGLLQVKDFSWEKCARETLEIIANEK
ncbi:MAG: Glycosyl transferase group 1 [Candidatus Woesebacteria bacterium GW2011_GWB1_41_10]|uniref:Glycosyl transferase group 1 n=1 Tax=Candidatus Woesebacteria bacterium GW2011_GWB1_41_10 TaxID=1618577 RepID=A0A0G0UCZ7_9BACT|nr:MAG: Glycosyl transferase group 1 [Candidatus Woesebacteria bacterium GW2011_GWB1_41_10]